VIDPASEDLMAIEGLHCEENLGLLRRVPSESIDLIYIDPPFNTGETQRLKSIKLGSGDQKRTGYAGRDYQFSIRSDHQYSDAAPRMQYLAELKTRLQEMHRTLTSTGSIYVHIDHHVSHHVRILLDEIFGEDHFLNEIVWAYDYGGRKRDRWPHKHDVIYWYAKGSAWTFNREEIDRLPYMAPGLVTPEKAARGKLPTDVWWMTIVPTAGRERTGYPTQKPLRLLERIVTASSNTGDLVADFYCGSGTSAVAAKNLGRRYLAVDSNREAIAIAGRRLAETPQRVD
jgi:site-specific DNA-methyltransferase (adenine-specific)